MKNFKKIIIGSMCLALVLGMFSVSASASAQTLKEKDVAARAKYNQAKEQYRKELNFYKSARQEFITARQKFSNAKSSENKAVLEENARDFLTKAVNTLIKRLESIKSWVSNRRALADNEKAAIVAEIDADIVWLKARLPNIEGASLEKLRGEATVVRDYWKEHRVMVKRTLGKIQAVRINFVIEKSENFSTRISAKIDELQKAGHDTSELEAWLADFDQKLVLAKERYETAKAKFSSISNLADADSLFREGNSFIKEANQYIKEAHALLKKIVTEMKTLAR